MFRKATVGYTTLGALLVVEPFVINTYFANMRPELLTSLFNLVIIGVATSFFLIIRNDLERVQQEKRRLLSQLRSSSDRLSDAYAYIGVANRRLPFFLTLTTGLLSKTGVTKRAKKEIFQELLSSAVVSIAKADWGILRIVHLPTAQTLREFSHVDRNYLLLKTAIGNGELLKQVEGNGLHEVGDLHVLSTADQSSPVRSFLILPKDPKRGPEEAALLQSALDQAQLLHHHIYDDKAPPPRV